MNKVAKGCLLPILFAIFLLASFAGSANAQGSRKDDVVFNAQGRPMAGATVRVCTASATGQPCSPVAPIYSDAALTQALANPLSADGLGNYTFYATPGRYEIEIGGPGITTKQLPNVILPSDPSTPTFTTVTTTSGISAFSLSLTGNLTVSGSTAVAGTLSVGGAPVPSTNADNQWVGNQRFGGPIPWRDFTKYMPAGGCSSIYPGFGDPPSQGIITSGTNTLNLNGAYGPADFKNGCGIAVPGAGPTSTVVMAGAVPGSAQICDNPPVCSGHTSTIVAFSPTTGGVPLVPGMGDGSDASGVISVTGCSNPSFNVTTQGWLLNWNNPVTIVTYSDGAGTGATGTGCTATFYAGWPHGVTGTTTYKYKVAPIDAHGGLGPAVGPITITNSQATLTPANFNFISFNRAPGIRAYAIYSDGGLGGAYSCINVAYTNGFEDWGLPLPFGCPAYIPATPPTVATAQTLNTTITAGQGTLALTLAANASNTVSSYVPVYDDVSMFLKSCIDDVITDQLSVYSNIVGSYGCYVPYGRWPFNADMPTDTEALGTQGINIYVAGTPLFQTWPWIIASGYQIYGMSPTTPGGNGTSFPTTFVERGEHNPSGAVIRGRQITLSGFNFANSMGNGVEITNDPGSGAGTAGITLKNLDLNPQDTLGTGVPLVIDSNILYLTAEGLNMQGNSLGYPASILFTGRQYCGNGQTAISLSNIFTEWFHVAVEAPGGQFGSGTAFGIGGWQSELHGANNFYGMGSAGFIGLDTGITGSVPACGAVARVSASIGGIENADSTTNNLLWMKGTGGSNAVISAGGFSPAVTCDATSIACAQQNTHVTINAGGGSVISGFNGDYIGETSQSAQDSFLVNKPFKVGEGANSVGQTPPRPEFASVIPPVDYIIVTGTGAGSLAAGTYCFMVTTTDFQASPGQSIPAAEQCKTVGASSSISLQWGMDNGAATANMVGGLNLWYGTTGPGSETHYIANPAASFSGGLWSYTFSSTAAGVSGTLPNEPTAYDTYIYRDYGVPSCIMCVTPAASSHYQLGVGEPSPPAGDKLAVKGGVLDAESGFKSALVTKSANYTLTTADYWVNVTGTTTITVPHANVGNHWVVFNSGSNTVTLQPDSGNINGAASITLSANTGKEIACDGTNCFAH